MTETTIASRSINPEDWGESKPGPLNGRIGAELADLLVNLVREQSGARSVCDLGCGTGYLAAKIGQLGHRVVGVDASAPYLEVARRHYSSENVSFRARYSASTLALRPQTKAPSTWWFRAM